MGVLLDRIHDMPSQSEEELTKIATQVRKMGLKKPDLFMSFVETQEASRRLKYYAGIGAVTIVGILGMMRTNLDDSLKLAVGFAGLGSFLGVPELVRQQQKKMRSNLDGVEQALYRLEHLKP